MIGLVLGGAFRRVVAGLVLGLPLAVGAGYLLSAQLYGVTFWDPVALAIAAGSLAVAAFIASIVPATRAAAMAPMQGAADGVRARETRLEARVNQPIRRTCRPAEPLRTRARAAPRRGSAARPC